MSFLKTGTSAFSGQTQKYTTATQKHQTGINQSVLSCIVGLCFVGCGGAGKEEGVH